MPQLISGLSSLAPDYKAVLSDIWGVVHNGVAAFPSAVDALVKFRAGGGRVVLITNAPRPNGPIHEQLVALGVPRDAYDDLVTSGDVTRDRLINGTERRIFHIGPERDLALYDGIEAEVVGESHADIIVVTGLYDDYVEVPEDYRARLTALAARGLPLVCANPDIVVERGDQLIWCAGALARLYEELGGRVEMLGKPFAPIYDRAHALLNVAAGRDVPYSEILAIGDGLPTDVRGAHTRGLDLLFVTGGIHAVDFGDPHAPDIELVRARLLKEGFAAKAAMPRLAW
jgi:HAD superfamily hydrolase (TIGR01459 family)